MKKIIIWLILILIININTEAATLNSSSINNGVKKAVYPDSKDVEPRVNQYDETTALEAGIENTIEVNLDDCLRLALGNNPRIQSAMQDVFASDARIKQVWSNYFPQFSWQSGYSRIRQLQLSDVFRENLIYNYWVLGQISGSQLLYDFGVTQNQVTIRKLDNEGYKIILTGTINDVVYNVKDNYYNLQYAIEAEKVAEQTVKEFEVFYNQAKAFYKLGIKPKVDVTIAEVNLSNSKLTLIKAQHAIKIATAKLNNSIGIPYTTKYNISDKLRFNECSINLNEAIEISQTSRPEFHLAEVKVEQAKQNVKLVKKTWLPQFNTQGQFEVGGRHPDSNYGYSFGAYINFPTINGMLIKHEIREARSLYSKEQANAINTKNNIYLEVQNAYYTLDEKRNKIPVAYLGMKQAKENAELSSGRYKAGVGDSTEVKDAQVEYENSQLTYLYTMYEYNSAKANLERSIGKNITEEVILQKN